MAGPQGGLVILRVATTGDATPAIAGLTPIASAMHGGQRVTLFALRDPGLFELTVSGSGEYSLDLRIAGDVNADGKVDGADSVALDDAAAGADTTGDGVVDAGDGPLVAASLVFLATTPPHPPAEFHYISTHVTIAPG